MTTLLQGPQGTPRVGWLARRFGGLPQTFWLLASGVLVARLGFFVIPFRTFYLAHERDLSPVQSSLVLAAFGAGWALSMPVGGWVTDRVGRRPVIIASAWSSAAAFLAYGSAREVVALAVTGFAAGLTFDLYRPAVQARIVDIVPGAQQPRALALLYLVLNIGRGAACLMGGLLAEHSFGLLFWLNAGVNIAFGLVVWRGLPPDAPRALNQARQPRVSVALKDPALLSFTGITLVFYLIHMQSVITLPIVIDEAGATPLAFGLILALDPISVAVLQLLIQHRITPDMSESPGRVTVPPLLVCGLGIALVGIGLVLAGMGTSMWWFAFTTPIWVSGEVLFFAVAQGTVAALAPAHLAGVYFGVWGCCQGVSALLAPLLASLLLAAGGTDLLWPVGAAAGIAAALACVSFSRAYRLRLATP